MKRRALLTFCCGLFFVSVSSRLSAEPTLTLAKRYSLLQEASVEVLVQRRLAGSGCFVDAEGTILTAAHVVDKSPRAIEVLLPSGERIAAALLALDQGHDLALLQVPAGEKPRPHLTLAEAIPPPGSHIYLFGAPLFRHQVLLEGMIARAEPTFEYVDGRYIEILHVAGLSAKGVSGGPWVNRAGELIGVQSSMIVVNDSQQGLAFMAPLAALQVLLQRRSNAATPTLGIAVEELWEQQETFFRNVPSEASGVVVRRLTEKGPGKSAGIAEGEIIESINGQPCPYRDQFLGVVRSLAPGQTVKLNIYSPGDARFRTVEMELGSLESP